MIDALKKISSPSVANAIETFKVRPREHGNVSSAVRALFPEMEALATDQGARGVIARDPSRVVEVALAGGGDDVDTAEDLTRLN